MKIKVIKADFEESTGTSIVTVSSPLGEFTGEATFNTEDGTDPRVMSRYHGCLIAEMRARIKALKAEKNKLSTEMKVLMEFYHRAQAMSSARNQFMPETLQPYNAFMAMYNTRSNRYTEIVGEIAAIQEALPAITAAYYNARKKSLAAIDSLNPYEEMLGQ